MSTRANIELYDYQHENDGVIFWMKGKLLYHHTDGYPSWMGPELEDILARVAATVKKAGDLKSGNSAHVAELMIQLSAPPGSFNWVVPRFESCQDLNPYVDYLWRVFLGPKADDYDIQCYDITFRRGTNAIESIQLIDWRQESE